MVHVRDIMQNFLDDVNVCRISALTYIIEPTNDPYCGPLNNFSHAFFNLPAGQVCLRTPE